MNYGTLSFNQNVRIEFSSFGAKRSNQECHAVFHVSLDNADFNTQLCNLHSAYEKFVKKTKMVAVFKRYFLSDIENQINPLKSALGQLPFCAVSIVQQPPLNGTKIALWVWFLSKAEDIGIPVQNNSLFGFQHNGYKHYLATEMYETTGNSEQQTDQILINYEEQLQQVEYSLKDNCVRTWLFVSDIDNNYSGVVKARKNNFTLHNLTEKTHYIASTGIAGRHANPKTTLLFDAYAIDGLSQEQIQFLYASENMSSTYDYGVTFERGVCIKYGDRNHIYISGTASIDNKGKVLHEGDILKQSDRMIENVRALLHEANSGFDDLAQIIVYLRDTADYKIVNEKMEKEFPGIPKIITLAPICRPAWLVEMECIAIKEATNNNFEEM